MPDTLPSVYNLIPKEYNVSGNYYNPNACDGVPIHPFMCGVIGGSRTRKTDTAIMTMLKCDNFGKIEIYAKNIGETIYNWLGGLADNLPEDTITVSDNIDELKAPEEFDPSIQTLVIIDDFVLDKKQGNALAIAQRGMKQNISMFYISQNFFRIHMDLRKNFTYLILKSINSIKSIKLMINDFNLDKEPDELLKMYKKAIAKPTDFLLIDINEPVELLKFRKNFDMFYCPTKLKWLPVKQLSECPMYKEQQKALIPSKEKLEENFSNIVDKRKKK